MGAFLALMMVGLMATIFTVEAKAEYGPVPANYDWTQFSLDGEWAGFGQILKVCGGKLITEEEFRK